MWLKSIEGCWQKKIQKRKRVFHNRVVDRWKRGDVVNANSTGKFKSLYDRNGRLLDEASWV